MDNRERANARERERERERERQEGAEFQAHSTTSVKEYSGGN